MDESFCILLIDTIFCRLSILNSVLFVIEVISIISVIWSYMFGLHWQIVYFQFYVMNGIMLCFIVSYVEEESFMIMENTFCDYWI